MAFLLTGLVLPFKRAPKKAKTVLKILREYLQVAQKKSPLRLLLIRYCIAILY